MKRKSVDAQCDSCGGTGVYSGFMEAKDEAVICITCGGTGCQVIRYIPFSQRRKRRGINVVRISRGRSILAGCGGVGDPISYAEFLKMSSGKAREI